MGPAGPASTSVVGSYITFDMLYAYAWLRPTLADPYGGTLTFAVPPLCVLDLGILLRFVVELFRCFLAMSSSRFHFLLSFLTLISPALGDGCQPKAISLPFASVKLVTNAEVRGVLWGIGGSNPQNITLMPSASVKSVVT
jgi:hypothetical protein